MYHYRNNILLYQMYSNNDCTYTCTCTSIKFCMCMCTIVVQFTSPGPGYYDDHICTVVSTQLTKKAGSWIPQLERMVQSRGLCPFEKQVLLTLIGFVIQPNKVSEYTCTLYMHVYVHVHARMFYYTVQCHIIIILYNHT